MMSVKITHSIYFTNLNCHINLKKLTLANINIVYSRTPFEVVKFNHRFIKGSALIYQNGKMCVHGPKDSVRIYARQVQQNGYNLKIKQIDFITQSCVYYLKSKVNIAKLVNGMDAMYNPEIFHGICFKRGRFNFTVYNRVIVIITGHRMIPN